MQGHKMHKDRVLYKGIENFRLRYCFSLMQSVPLLFGEKTQIQYNIVEQDKSNISKDEIHIKRLGGLKSLSYFLTVLFVSNYFQIDLMIKNRWKNLETLTNQKSQWILSSILYLFIDHIFFIVAFIQTNRTLKYFYNYYKSSND